LVRYIGNVILIITSDKMHMLCVNGLMENIRSLNPMLPPISYVLDLVIMLWIVLIAI